MSNNLTRLRRQANGRWAIDDVELHAGDPVKVCFTEPQTKSLVCYFNGRIEHDGRDYYFAWPDVSGDCFMPLQLREGLLAVRL